VVAALSLQRVVDAGVSSGEPARGRSRAARRPAGPGGYYGSYAGWKITVIRVLTGAALVGIWQLVSGRVLPVYSVSTPVAVAKQLWAIIGTQSGWINIGVTAKELALGFVIGVAGGTILGILLGSVRVVGLALEPFISGINGIPKIALAPVFVLILGIGTWTDAVIAALMVALIIFYNLYMAMRDIDEKLVNMVRIAGGSRFDVIRYVVAPSLVTPFFAGIKAAGPFAILGVILGEFVASFEGIGHVLSAASTNLDAATVYAAIIVLVAFGFILSMLLNLADRWVSRRLGMA
jgi:NitT/TauT family transport system permease protein